MKGPEISTKIFGGILDFDAAGYYPGLELLNLTFSATSNNILSNESNIKFIKESHDFARRLVWDFDTYASTDKCKEAFVNDNAKNVVKELLECLQMPIPNINKTPSWERAHFFPYCRSLIHWDARLRSRKIKIERRYLRGGGALAHRVLRDDPNEQRVDVIREGLKSLYPEEQITPLQQLSDVLSKHSVKDTESSDPKESACKVNNDSIEDVFRDGLCNILSHCELSCTSRIKAVISWTGFWLAIMQAKRASEYVDSEIVNIIVDCGSSPGQIRRASARCLKDISSMIGDAIDKCVLLADDDDVLAKAQRRKIISFFSSTCATIGLLNSFKGKRHFTFSVELLETLVLAGTYAETEIPFERFVTEIFYSKWGLIVGRQSAEKANLLSVFDASIFEDNEEYLACQMKAAGLITDYSDATRMVSTRGLI